MTVQLTDKQIGRGPKAKQLAKYFRTARDRYNAFAMRSAGQPRPWSEDPIFQHYRFCNVYREDDKVTIWLRENWREPYADHPNLPFAMALARLINWPPTLEEIGFPKRWNPSRVEDILHERKIGGEKVYTGAYLLGAVPQGVPRQVYLVEDVLSPLYRNLKAYGNHPEYGLHRCSLSQAWDYFRGFRGIGDFLAYEIVSDLRHTKYLCNAPDIMKWANAGPGALRGLTRLWGHQPKTQHIQGHSFPKKFALEAMQQLLNASRINIPKFMPKWEMREVEHWLCEFDKYERISQGQGVLERFTPKAAGEW